MDPDLTVLTASDYFVLMQNNVRNLTITKQNKHYLVLGTLYDVLTVEIVMKVQKQDLLPVVADEKVILKQWYFDRESLDRDRVQYLVELADVVRDNALVRSCQVDRLIVNVEANHKSTDVPITNRFFLNLVHKIKRTLRSIALIIWYWPLA